MRFLTRSAARAVLASAVVLAILNGSCLEGAEGAQDGKIAINFSRPVELKVFLDYISKRSGTTFIYDEDKLNAAGKVTLLAPTAIPEDDMYRLLEALLEYRGLALEPIDDLYVKVRSAKEAGTKPMPFYLPDELDDLPDTDAMVTAAYKIRYAGLPDIQTAIAPLLSTGKGAVIILNSANVIVMTDYARNVKRVMGIIRLVDNPDSVPDVRMFTLQWANAQVLGQLLQRVVQHESNMLGIKGPRQPKVDFDIMTNTVIVVAIRSTMDKIADLISDLDAEPDPGNRNFMIYRLKNAKAEDIASTLQKLLTASPSGVRTAGPRRAGARGRQAAPTAVMGVLGGAEVRIIDDKGQNAIIVVAPPEIQLEIKALIDDLDRLKPQVLIEALVVLVTTGNDLDVGIELSTFGVDGLGVTEFGFSKFDFETGERTILSGLGLTGAWFHNEDVPVILKALLVESKGKIISRPWILANDNAEASFESVEQEPFTSVNSLTSTTATTSFGDYADAGTKFTFTPHISEGNYLNLEMKLELSQFTGESTSPEVPPARRSDIIETVITVPDNVTIIIGGLKGYNKSRVVSKVPLLGDIPLLGHLFRRTVTVYDEGTEYIFIRAQIVNDEEFNELMNVSRDAREQAQNLEPAKAATDLLQD